MKQPSIVIAEDEAIIADDLERTVGRWGYGVKAIVATGEGAVAAALEHLPDIVLMDIKLQGHVDGIEAARSIRAKQQGAVVFMTSHSDSATLARASGVRPHGYVLKPYVERELRVAIELAVNMHQVERASVAHDRWGATVLQCIDDGVLATNAQGHVTYLNHAAERLLGWSLNEALGRPLDELMRFVDAAGAVLPASAKGVLATHQPKRLPGGALLVTRAGAKVPLEDTAAPIINEERNLQGSVTVLRDVSERRGLEQRTARAEHMASLGTLAAGVCHEINNPLASVLSNVDFALAGPALGSDVREALADVRDAALRIADIVRDIRLFAQPPRQPTATTSLPAAIDAAAKLTSHLIRQHAVLERRFEPVRPVLADASRLTQVFVNVLANAAQATPTGDAARHTIVVRCFTDEHDWVVAEIGDEGSGMAQPVLARIFDPFFTTKSPGQGMGLGLSICRSIIMSFGGEISARSEVGRGTTVQVRLPPARPGDGAAAVEPSA